MDNAVDSVDAGASARVASVGPARTVTRARVKNCILMAKVGRGKVEFEAGVD